MNLATSSAPGKLRLLLASAPLLVLAACGSAPKQPGADSARPPAAKSVPTPAAALPKAGSGRGAYYKDDGPGDNPPPGLENTVDPIPVLEDFSRSGNKPYAVFGKTYTPLADNTTPLVQRGIGSWYGKKFHGQKTSSGELYDMYKITAAHPTLPIPSYARVTNLANGKQIIVRINDRGPFHSSRIIDLSYTAALKLDLLGKGSSQIEVERLLPSDIERMAENRKNQPAAAVAATTPVEKTAMSPDDVLAAQDKPAEKVQPAGGGFYLQLGAYAIRANAESVMTRLKAQARLPAFAAFAALDIVQQGSLYRLLSGPFGSRSEAAAALAQAGELGIARPLVLQR
ncbi:MAG: septal ring lytic transglycosylase RlpA family protein [Burkholderiales bacterium]|nr:septal ring lytic transglycosylase RlpA family protein [Burkholderiales bacterium]